MRRALYSVVFSLLATVAIGAAVPPTALAATSSTINAPAKTDECTKTSGLTSPVDINDVALPKTGCGDNASPLPNILRVVFGITTGLSTIFVALGAFKYVTSGGSSDAVESAKKTILYAVLGLALSVSAFAIIGVVANSLGSI